jgi:N-acetylmuramoyl-L-alanine amidase
MPPQSRVTPAFKSLPLILCLFCFGFARAAVVWAAEEGAPAPAIVLDPGHGGDDAGLRVPTLFPEKTMTLAFAQSLQKVLQQRGLTAVTLTRNRDTALSLTARQAAANRRGSDVYISLHMAEPASGPPVMRVFANRFVRDEELAKLAGGETKWAVQAVPADLAQNSTLRRSQQLGQALVQGWRQATTGPAVFIPDAPLAGVRLLRGPAVLVELPGGGRGQNYGLADEAGRLRAAAALADGIEMFLGRR